MILGAYYLTVQIDGEKGEGMYFSDKDEALMAYQNGDVGLHCKVKVRMSKEIDNKKEDEKKHKKEKTLIFKKVNYSFYNYVWSRFFDLFILYNLINENLSIFIEFKLQCLIAIALLIF